MDDSIRFMSLDDLSSCYGQRDHEKATAAVHMRYCSSSDRLLQRFRYGSDAVRMRFRWATKVVQMGYCSGSSDEVRMQFRWATMMIWSKVLLKTERPRKRTAVVHRTFMTSDSNFLG